MNAIILTCCLSQFTDKVKTECQYDQCQTDLEKVTALREWAWANTTYCVNGLNALEVERKDWFLSNERTAQELYEEMGTSPVMCGGAGVALKRLYESFGFKAWGVAHSVGGFNHYATLVQIEHKKFKMNVLQDPSWNVDFRLSDGEPISHTTLQRLLEDRRDTLIVPNAGRVLKWPSVRLRASQASTTSFKRIVKACCAVDEKNWEDRGDGRDDGSGDIVIHSPRTWANWTAKKTHFAAKVTADGYPANHLYFYARTSGVYP